DEGTTARLASDAAALTHGAPAAHRAAASAALAVRAGLDLGVEATQRWQELLEQLAQDEGTSSTALGAALAAALEEMASGLSETGGVPGVVRRLGSAPDPDTAGYAAALVASARGYRPADGRPQSAVDSVIHQMHHRWVEAVLGAAPEPAG
ncbi:MAG: hypothetical protein L0J11_11055, partial [Micrococcaceae bacterium]|nr:hypothetical protein [Micrococcaceae bacterium]